MIEEVLASQEQAADGMPSPAEPERDGAGADTSEGARKPEEQHQEPQPACSPEERRHSQRERLNHILLSLLDKIPGKNGERGAAAVGVGEDGRRGGGERGGGTTCRYSPGVERVLRGHRPVVLAVRPGRDRVSC